MRQIVLDTETTGLEVEQGHRVIEIGCIELLNRRPTGRTFHHYLQPDRAIDAGAVEVHGITAEMLRDKPRFTDIAAEFAEFISDAELIIHNAEFDMGFIRAEFARLGEGQPDPDQLCRVTDTLPLARRLHPGQRNSLDALCRRYGVDNSGRDLHGALLDAQLLADVYLAMTGGQTALSLDDAAAGTQEDAAPAPVMLDRSTLRLVTRPPSAEDRAAHERYLEMMAGHAPEAGVLWRTAGSSSGT
ncbi:MAG: DNA polymerase III subunit epsilon [Chromatiales bacterium]|nr:DNA polymerase III subunit epsilon [Chromatiales bacterium]